jgi:hypothetical protein
MATKTTETTVTFRRPFKLTSIDEVQPPGTYRLVTDVEEIPDISFRAMRRTATMLHTPALSTSSGHRHEVFLVDPEELAAALEADGRA